MNFELLSLLLAAGGGFFAAAIGALHAFIFTGLMVVSGVGILLAGLAIYLFIALLKPEKF